MLPAPARAHANLLRSDPPANDSLSNAPAEIRLWFSEPVASVGLRVTLRDNNGDEVQSAPPQIDPADAHQVTLVPGDLADGIYTLDWRVVSGSDGHPTQGSFAFAINAIVTEPTQLVVDEAVVEGSVATRLFHLIALSLLIGGLAFARFVWRSDSGDARPLHRLLWLGWGLLGAALVALLTLQTAITADVPLLGALSSPALPALLFGSSYGALWWARIALWLLLALALRAGEGRTGAALVLSTASALAHSLFSHAAGALDPAAIAISWLHLTTAALWIGGLMAFVFMLRGAKQAGTASTLTARFGNLMRVAVFTLVIAGAYGAWLHIGSLDALLNTVYGQAQLLKLAAFLPMLALAGINLLITGRRLAAGQDVWVGRLRWLVRGEVALALVALVGASIMTSSAPAREIHAQRQAFAQAAAAPPAEAEPYFSMVMANDQMMHLEITPGYVGVNQFTITPFDAEGNPITDASLIRLRFDSLDENLGQSELRPESLGDGVYNAQGANLSVPGRWRIRMTVQRPDQFDVVADFEAVVTHPPAAPPPPVIDPAPASSERRIALLGAGALLVIGGGAAATLGQRRAWAGGLMLAVGALAVINGFMVRGGLLASEGWMLAMPSGYTGGVYVDLVNETGEVQTLVAFETDVSATARLHQTVIENDMARMETVEQITLAAGETLRIAPGSYHLMLEGLMRELRVGERFTVTLVFASGARLPVEVRVRDTVPP
jgi:copper transport protein